MLIESVLLSTTIAGKPKIDSGYIHDSIVSLARLNESHI